MSVLCKQTGHNLSNDLHIIDCTEVMKNSFPGKQLTKYDNRQPAIDRLLYILALFS